MFNADFYPTPSAVAHQMIEGYDLHGKTVLEPSAGAGDLVRVLQEHGAKVIACEKHEDLRTIVKSKCDLIGTDFLQITSEQISHVDFIVMNPPFSKGVHHILHAWKIAPPGCRIIALCNAETVQRRWNTFQEQLGEVIDSAGNWENIGNCFSSAERKTEVEVALVKLEKPGASHESEFEGFFLEDDQPEAQASGLMPYNVVRDLVNRYVEAMKIFDEQSATAIRLHSLLGGMFSGAIDGISISFTKDQATVCRSTFKKCLQRDGWKWIFDKMDLGRVATRGLREDINKFVEKQTQIPFTMRNIYRMLEIVIGTTEQRMDKAILEVFDKLTEHYDDNRFKVEGWKTNSHYLVNRKFIFPWGARASYSRGLTIDTYQGCGETLGDLEKALCFLTGENWNEVRTFAKQAQDMTAGQWYFSHFFKFKAYKKRTVHCEFLNEDLWGQFNQRVAKLKGYPLYEYKSTKETDRRDAETAKRHRPVNNSVELQLFQQ